MTRGRRFVRLLLALFLVATTFASFQSGLAAPPAEKEDPLAKAQSILRGLTPEERVGQLFLVTFKGRQVDEASQIYDLITKHHIGGVVLLAGNDNFTGPDQTVQNASQLIDQLQQIEWEASQASVVEPSSGGKTFNPGYIPLFVGIDQEGDGYPTDQILNGLTPIPDMMAIGATWNPESSTQVGTVVGKELEAIGVNLYLGPSLDVSDPYDSGLSQDTGAGVFGGSPYWTGEMGRALIAGIHQGSNNRIAVISKHFPGSGSSDRDSLQEVATVRKTLDQLMQADLAPFMAVTGGASSTDTLADGLLVSHIRYQGLQGNTRDIPKPLSFDAQALNQLLQLQPFSTWRSNGGLLVSDDLGSRAVRRMVDPTLQNYDPRQVARDAFLAGNDLLFGDNLAAPGDPDSYTGLVRTLVFFAQKYREDPVFQQRVDASVTRILGLKLKLYPSFELTKVQPPERELSDIGIQSSQDTIFNVARQAVTLVNPGVGDLGAVLPQAPSQRERIIFFTDTLNTKQCSTCPDQAQPAVDALQNAVIRLYGPASGGRVNTSRLSSYSFGDLSGLINNETAVGSLQDDLAGADWVVFSMLQSTTSRRASQALKQLLNERPELVRNKRVIVFAFNAPDYLDATDISKVTAFYALYSKIPVFQDVAARVLFQELPPAGQPPVSIPGAGYNLMTAMTPDPGQSIPLYLDISQPQSVPGETTPTPEAMATFKVGDTLPLRTGVIVDHNQHPVADGTPVRFIFTRTGDVNSTQEMEASTAQGVARASFRIDGPGLLEIRVEARPATNSGLIRLDVARGESAGATVLPPATPTPTVTPTPTITPTPTATQVVVPAPVVPSRPQFEDWLLAMVVIGLGSALVYFAGLWWGSTRWGFRWGLCAVLGGLAVYSYLAIGMPGGRAWVQSSGRGGILGLTALGVMVGWMGGMAWRAWWKPRPVKKGTKASSS